MHRFFMAPELLTHAEVGSSVMLPEKLAHQVRDVLHLAPGEQILLLDNSGDEMPCTVTKSARGGVEVRLQERRIGKREPSVRITLCQGLLKSARFEWILEKGTELGVTTFAPILCQRSTSGLEEAGPSKIARWQRIIQEAAEQCGRARLPELRPIRPLAHALDTIPTGAFAFIPWEEEHMLGLRDALHAIAANEASSQTDPLTIVLFIGPEGGLQAEEVEMAQRHHVQAVTLGPRILRAETAAITAVANVVYELEL